MKKNNNLALLFSDELLSPKKSGMILVVVLMLLAIVSGLAVSLMASGNADIERSLSILDEGQALGYLRATQIWAKAVLQMPASNNRADLIQWPKIMPELQQLYTNNNTVNARLYDAQGFYNINNAAFAENKDGFAYFLSRIILSAPLADGLQSVETTATTENLMPFVNEIIYWISALQTGPSNGPDKAANSAPQFSHDKISYYNNFSLTPVSAVKSPPVPKVSLDTQREDYYLNLNPSYRPAHQFFQSPSELFLVKFYQKSFYELIKPYLIALPEITPVNINTASAQIMMSLGKGIPWDKAQQLVMARGRISGFENTGDFLSQQIATDYAVSARQITVSSQYYLLKTIITLPPHKYQFFTLFKKMDNYSDINSVADQKTPVINQDNITLLWVKQNYL